MRVRSYFVYILASDNRTIYIGVTRSLVRRIYQHKEGRFAGFSKTYKCHKLVYWEHYTDVRQAIAREKQLKNWRREKKRLLIERMNVEWIDLTEKYISEFM